MTSIGKFVTTISLMLVLNTSCSTEIKTPPVDDSEISKVLDDPEMVAELTRAPACDTAHPFFDTNPDYFREVEAGEFTVDEYSARTKHLPNGEKVFEDIGLTFYWVERGDTLDGIRQKLGKYEEYAYLKNDTYKLLSFNITPKRLRAGMWIPIPVRAEDRRLTDEQFAEYSRVGIADILLDPQYGPQVAGILKKISLLELKASLLAFAKKESGGEPLGKFVYHRWEPGPKVYSFSPMHILMNGPGLQSRRHLSFSEGQTIHPRNAVQMFLGYFIEKSYERRKDPAVFFPIDDNVMSIAPFYNGSGWRSRNPDYATKLTAYYKKSVSFLQALETDGWDCDATPIP